MNPKYRPITLVQKLGYLAEECGEVLAAVGKTLRWGLESSNPELPEKERETNRDWILRELLDLENAIALVRIHLRRPGQPEFRSQDMWHAFECLSCNANVVFDVRMNVASRHERNNAPLDKAPCPVCGSVCEYKATWPADEDGYGSRASEGRD